MMRCCGVGCGDGGGGVAAGDVGGREVARRVSERGVVRLWGGVGGRGVRVRVGFWACRAVVAPWLADARWLVG